MFWMVAVIIILSDAPTTDEWYWEALYSGILAGIFWIGLESYKREIREGK